MNKRHLIGLMAALPLAWLAGCGGGDDSNDANVRLVNASAGYASLDLYVKDDLEISAVGFGTGSDYTGVPSGDSVENVLTSAGSTTELLNQSRTLSSGKKYTIIAYGWEGALKSVIFTDDEDKADSNKSKVSVFNGAVGAGSVDVYLTGEDESLESVEPIQSSVAEGASGNGYATVTSGTYRLRVTAAGDTDDLRLDVSGVVVESTDVVNLVLSPGAGGVLVNAIGVVQGGDVTPYLNTKARIRVVPAVAGGARVTVTAGSTTVASNAVSPSIGQYQLVTAGTMTLATSVAGTALPDQAITLAAGADMTVLVTGTSVAEATVNAITDDNRLPTTTSRFKVRLVHAAPSLAERPVTMAINSSQVVSNLEFGAASDFETEVAVNDARLELSEPNDGIFYSDAEVDFITGSVYTVFVFDYSEGPSVVLTTGR
jgi:hypothetical protein